MQEYFFNRACRTGVQSVGGVGCQVGCRFPGLARFGAAATTSALVCVSVYGAISRGCGENIAQLGQLVKGESEISGSWWVGRLRLAVARTHAPSAVRIAGEMFHRGSGGVSGFFESRRVPGSGVLLNEACPRWGVLARMAEENGEVLIRLRYAGILPARQILCQRHKFSPRL